MIQCRKNSTLYFFVVLWYNIIKKMMQRINMKETNKDRMIKMDKVLCYIKEHIAEDVTAQQVAREFNYTTKYFEKLFKQYFNIPFPKYWTKLKMRYIASKLITKEFILGKGMVSETGYANSAGFSKAFKKEFGISPTDFLKQNKEVPDMPVRCELFGVKIDFEYVTSSSFIITGNPITIEDQDFSDAAEYIIEKAAWGLEKSDVDIQEEIYGLLWHDEKIDVLPPHARDFSRELGGFLLEF